MEPYKADWKDKNKYPPIDCDDTERIAWEFLRRNPEYAKHVAAITKLKEGEFNSGIKSKSNSLLTATECAPPAKKDETAVSYYERMKLENKKGKIYKPSIIFRARWSLLEPVCPDQDYDPKKIQFVKFEVKAAQPKNNHRQSLTRVVAENEIILRFRLDINFVPQLISALARLKEAANQYEQLTIKKPSKLRNTRKDSVLNMAHLWLRCYDAYQSPKKFDTDPNKKRKRTNGPQAIVEHLKSEVPINSKDIRANVNEKNPPDWKDRANDYINNKLYLKLIFHRPSTKEVNALEAVMNAWKSKGSQQK